MRELDKALLYDFDLADTRLRLWKRVGESYEHVLMKALGYLMFAADYPEMRVEHSVGLRYKPDLVAQDVDGRFRFWGECGQVSTRKITWLLKHARVERLVVFKINSSYGITGVINELQAEIPVKQLTPGRLTVIGFTPDIVERTLSRRIDEVLPEWYTMMSV